MGLQKPSPESLELEQGSAATRCGLLGLPYGILLGIAEVAHRPVIPFGAWD